MKWRDQGALLSVRRHGENAAIIDVFTEQHGRHAGVVRGGSGRRLAPILQPGAQLDVEWNARLESHLGSYRVEPLVSRAAFVLGDRLGLAGLNAICGLLVFSLPEREAHPRLYQATLSLLDMMGKPDAWLGQYLAWELLLLEELGFGLDLQTCAVTGSADGLEYVSPRTGRAVSAKGAGEWGDRLLAYPDPRFIAASLQTTGYFLENQLAQALGDKDLPEARTRFVSLISRAKNGGTDENIL